MTSSKGIKTEGRFLATYNSARAASLAAILAKNQTWQCPTLVWGRGGNLIDTSDFSKDARVNYVSGSWRTKTWKRFTDEITQAYRTDDLATRKKFIEKELEVVGMLHKAGCRFSREPIRRLASIFFQAPACMKNCSASLPPDSLRWKRCKPPR
jgi:hypothetical protein